MKRVEIAPLAQNDISRTLEQSRQAFGLNTARRYGLLIKTATHALAHNPERAGVQLVAADPLERRRRFHLKHARALVAAPDRIKTPRHLIVFRVAEERLIVLRLLHEAMDLPARISGDGS